MVWWSCLVFPFPLTYKLGKRHKDVCLHCIFPHHNLKMFHINMQVYSFLTHFHFLLLARLARSSLEDFFLAKCLSGTCPLPPLKKKIHTHSHTHTHTHTHSLRPINKSTETQTFISGSSSWLGVEGVEIGEGRLARLGEVS